VTLALEVLSDYCCDLMRFNYFSNQIANRIAMFQMKSFNLKSNHQNGSNRDLNPNRDWDLPITALYIHFRELLPSDGILPGAKFTLLPSLAFFHIGSATDRHSSSRRQPNFAACYKEWNYRTFAEGATYIRLGGHHVGHWPTF